MKLTKSVSLLLLTLVIGTVSVSSKAENVVLSSQLAQASQENQNEALKEKAENFLSLFLDKKFAQVRVLLTPDLKSEISAERIQRIWIRTISANGSFKEIIKSRVINTPTSNLVFVTVKFARVTEDWIVIFNNNQEIVGLDLPNSESIDQIAIEVVNSLAAEDFANVRGYLHPFLKEDIFPQQVQQKWKQLLRENGDFKKVVDTVIRRGSSAGDTDIVFVTIEFTNNTDDMLFIFDNKKSIIGVDFPEN